MIGELVNFPAELRALRRWVAWRIDVRDGKSSKRPLQLVNDERKWLSLSGACDFVVRGRADGVGFVLGDGIVGIDLDACINVDGTVHAVARDAIETLGTYAEKSPSGRGLHLLVRGAIQEPRKICKRDGVPGREIYDGREGSARFFTVTGERFGSAQQLAEGPQAQAALDALIAKWFVEQANSLEAGDDAHNEQHSLDDDGVLQVMFAAKDGEKWRVIFDGDHSGYPSRSEADLALCRKLRFFTGANRAQMNRLFRRSGLMRPKWNERHGAQTYGHTTIAKAIAKGGPCYAPKSSDKDQNAERRRLAHERSAWARFPLWWVGALQGTGELAFRAVCVIASYADAKTGEAYPSVATLAAHCQVKERTMKAALKKVRAIGILTSIKRPGTSNLYRLARSVPEAITPYARLRKATVSEIITLDAMQHKPTTVSEVITPDAKHRSASQVMESSHPGCWPLGTITDQEPTTVDTGGKTASTFKRSSRRVEGLAPLLPEPSISLSPSARALRDDMLRGPVGRLFLENGAV
ncbi:MAG TPA: helix-turn-helix domain-containing protein [Candidatus Binatia bacterium]|nr:helix-turn-helix domain-containing protein [Candidatus Binatia bacterium]